jgi:hypothetical protein
MMLGITAITELNSTAHAEKDSKKKSCKKIGIS